MPRGKGLSPGGWLLLLVIILVFLLPVAIPLWIFLSEKSYEFPRVSIDATVRPNGSLDLVERRTFDFDGEFSFAFFTIDWPVDQIEGFTISEQGKPLPFADESTAFQFKARWRFEAEDEERTFTMRYTAHCAVDVWADTAHLNWQFIGTGWEVPTEHATVRVHLPQAATKPGKIPRPQICPPPAEAAPFETRPLAAGETLAWGHGPLGGEVRLPDPQTVTLEVSELPPYTFVEGSIVFPETAVPFAYQIPAPNRQSIVDNEVRLAEQANAERRRLLALEAEFAEARQRMWLAMAGFVLVLSLLVLISRLRDRVPGIPRMLEEPPEDIHPVLLAQLWATASGRLGTQEIYRTQMLHLAQIGAIELQAVGPVSDPDDFRVRLRDVKDARPDDMEFLEFLFPKSTDDEIALSSLKPTGARKSELRQWWKEVESSGNAARRRLLPERRWESILTTVLGILAFIAGFIVPGFVDSPLGLLWIPLSVLGMAVAHAEIRPRIGEEGRARMGRWRAFRRFLKTFSSLPEAPALAVVIWERYLVYATALGVADEVEKQVKALIPVQELPEPWKGAPSGLDGYTIMRSFSTVPVHSAASVAPPSTSSSSSGIGSFSSSSGGGGGFSGGGGGGGGGTGGGAG